MVWGRESENSSKRLRPCLKFPDSYHGENHSFTETFHRWDTDTWLNRTKIASNTDSRTNGRNFFSNIRSAWPQSLKKTAVLTLENSSHLCLKCQLNVRFERIELVYSKYWAACLVPRSPTRGGRFEAPFPSLSPRTPLETLFLKREAMSVYILSKSMKAMCRARYCRKQENLVQFRKRYLRFLVFVFGSCSFSWLFTATWLTGTRVATCPSSSDWPRTR